jgi:flagellar biosynthesis protein FliQ
MKNCEKCGIANTDDAVFCSACGAPLAQASVAEEAPAPVAEPIVTVEPVSAPSYDAYTAPANTVPTEKNTATLWLILNIVLTVVCCGNILGIIGIVFSALGMGAYNKGDYNDMNQKAKIAKILFIVGIVLGVVGLIVGIATGLLSAITNINSFNSFS